MLMGLENFPSTAGGFTPSSAESAAWLARVSGLSNTERNAYDTMITGMVNDGVWSLLDWFYIFATNTQTSALLNLISTSYTGTTNGTVSFTADRGYTGDGSTFYIDTGWKPTNGTNFTQNSATLGWYDLTSSTTSSNQVPMGQDAGTNRDVLMIPRDPSNNFVVCITSVLTTLTVANANRQGSYIVTRGSSTSVTAFRNGSSIISGGASVSGALSASNLYLFADNGSAGPRFFYPNEMSAAFGGGSMNGTQLGNMQSRLNTYMTALGINVY